MRAIVFFDLPVITSQDRKNYSDFRKYLIRNGFIMMQKSVYAKLALNNSIMQSIKLDLKHHLPPEGLVEILEITEKQFNQIEYLCGSKQTKIVESDERLVIL